MVRRGRYSARVAGAVDTSAHPGAQESTRLSYCPCSACIAVAIRIHARRVRELIVRVHADRDPRELPREPRARLRRLPIPTRHVPRVGRDPARRVGDERLQLAQEAGLLEPVEHVLPAAAPQGRIVGSTGHGRALAAALAGDTFADVLPYVRDASTGPCARWRRRSPPMCGPRSRRCCSGRVIPTLPSGASGAGDAGPSCARPRAAPQRGARRRVALGRGRPRASACSGRCREIPPPAGSAPGREPARQRRGPRARWRSGPAQDCGATTCGITRECASGCNRSRNSHTTDRASPHVRAYSIHRDSNDNPS